MSDTPSIPINSGNYKRNWGQRLNIYFYSVFTGDQGSSDFAFFYCCFLDFFFNVDLFLLFFKFIFNWRIIALQCRVCFCHTTA